MSKRIGGLLVVLVLSGCGGGSGFQASDAARNLSEGVRIKGVNNVDQLDTTCDEAKEGGGFDCNVKPKAGGETRRYRMLVDEQTGAWSAVATEPEAGADGTYGCCIEKK